MILKKGKPIKKDIFINTGKIEFRSRAAQALAPRVGFWNLRFVWDLMLEI